MVLTKPTPFLSFFSKSLTLTHSFILTVTSPSLSVLFDTNKKNIKQIKSGCAATTRPQLPSLSSQINHEVVTTNPDPLQAIMTPLRGGHAPRNTAMQSNREGGRLPLLATHLIVPWRKRINQFFVYIFLTQSGSHTSPHTTK